MARPARTSRSSSTPTRRAGRAGAGMVHRVAFRVASQESLDFWQERVGGERNDGSLVFDDPEGLTLELVVDDSGEEPLIAKHPEIPEEHALRGFAGVRAYTPTPSGAAASSRGRSASSPASLRAATNEAVTTRTTSPTGAVRKARGRCITSPGRRRRRSTKVGALPSSRPACARRRSSTASTSSRSTSASRAACSSRSRRSARVRRGRAGGTPRRTAVATAGVRAPARAGGAGADAAAEPARARAEIARRPFRVTSSSAAGARAWAARSRIASPTPATTCSSSAAARTFCSRRLLRSTTTSAARLSLSRP